jgi:hypothetical protein
MRLLLYGRKANLSAGDSLPWITEKLSAYWREAAFGWRATRTWADYYALLHNTIQFHIRNGIGCACNSRGTVSIGLWIDRDRPITLTVRPFAGDLFVLYEVLAFKAYHISSALLPADNVRVIVDCGANIGITSLFLAARYPRAKILSVEPHPENFALLKTNVEGVSRILPIRACVTGTPQSAVRFTADQAAWGTVLLRIPTGCWFPQ